MSTNSSALARTPQAGMTATEGFDNTAMEVSAETASTAIAARATAVAQAKFIMAMKNPRDIENVRLKLLRACERPGFAGSLTEKVFGAAWYKKPVGDGVEGFSIRFAEEAIRALGNIDVQVVTLFDDPRQRIVEVTVMDLEANISYPTSISLEKTVERSKLGVGQVAIRTRINSYGKPVYVVPATDDEVFMKQQNLVSKAIRNGALRLLPGDIQAECRERILAIRQGEIAKDPDGFKRRVLDAFAALNVMPAMLEEYLGHPLAVCSPAELDDLRSLHLALKEGKITWAEVMAPADGDESAKTKADEPAKPAGTTLDDAAAKLVEAARVKAEAADRARREREAAILKAEAEDAAAAEQAASAPAKTADPVEDEERQAMQQEAPAPAVDPTKPKNFAPAKKEEPKPLEEDETFKRYSLRGNRNAE